MKSIATTLLWVGISLIQFGPAFANEKLPLKLDLGVHNRRGQTEYLQGQPISGTLSLLNAQVRRAEEEATEKWRESARKAEKEGKKLPPRQELKVPLHLMVTISKSDFFTLRFGKKGNVFWEETKPFPDVGSGKPLTLGKSPTSYSFKIPLEVCSKLTPGEYWFNATYRNADPAAFVIIIKAAKTDQDQAVLNYELAEYFLRRGEWDTSIKYAQLALGKLPFERDMPYLTLGDAYVGKGELEKAVEAYEKFLKAYEGSQRWHYPSIVRRKVEELKQEIKTKRGPL